MIFTKLGIGKKIWLLCLLLLLNTLLVGGFSYLNDKTLIQKLHEVANTNLPAVRNMTLIDMMHDGIRAVVYRGIVALQKKDAGELQAIHDEYSEFSKQTLAFVAELKKLNLSQNTKELISKTQPALLKYVEDGQTLIDLIKDGKVAEANAKLPGFSNQFKVLEAELEKMGEAIESETVESTKQSTSVSQKTQLLSQIMMVFSGSFGLFLAFLIIRSLTRQLAGVSRALTSSVDSLQDTSRNILTASESVAHSATEQAATITETVAGFSNIAELIRKTAQSSNESASLSKESHDELGKSHQVLREVMDSIRSIQESNEQLSQLKDLIQEISQKTGIINDIVFQTSLLSFNASIEASRAGEHGRGFSIVASEVGKLASMSGDASTRISKLLSDSDVQVEQIVKGIKSRVNLASDVSKKHEEAFAKLGENLANIIKFVENISRDALAQDAGIVQTQQQMKEMENVVHSNNKSSLTLLETSRSVAKVVAEVRDATAIMDQLIQGKNTAPVRPPSPHPSIATSDKNQTRFAA